MHRRYILLDNKKSGGALPTQDEPQEKAFFAFLGGLACDLEGVGAGARQLSKFKTF